MPQARASTSIQSIRHSDTTFTLEIGFSSGRARLYRAVVTLVYDRFIKAGSHDAFFREFIKDSYPCVIIESGPARNLVLSIPHDR